MDQPIDLAAYRGSLNVSGAQSAIFITACTKGLRMTPTVGPGAVAAFRKQLSGRLVCPEDRGYEIARRVWNGRIDRRPALVAFCADEADVVAAVQFARENAVLLAIRGGGHSCAGTAVCDDGLVIDLSLMKTIAIRSTAT
jgi:hypothetical protein